MEVSDTSFSTPPPSSDLLRSPILDASPIPHFVISPAEPQAVRTQNRPRFVVLPAFRATGGSLEEDEKKEEEEDGSMATTDFMSIPSPKKSLIDETLSLSQQRLERKRGVGPDRVYRKRTKRDRYKRNPVNSRVMIKVEQTSWEREEQIKKKQEEVLAVKQRETTRSQMREKENIDFIHSNENFELDVEEQSAPAEKSFSSISLVVPTKKYSYGETPRVTTKTPTNRQALRPRPLQV